MRDMHRLLTAAVLINAVAYLKGNEICPVNNPEEKVILFPDYTNCSRYYECNWGEKVLMECPEGLHFNPQEDVCDWPENAECNTNTVLNRQIRIVPNDKECPLENPSIDILLPHESDCAKFYKCDRGHKVLQNCPEGLHFNPQEDVCDWPENSNCSNNAALSRQIISIANDEECPLENPPIDILLPHESDCAKFYKCDRGHKVVQNCPDGLHFNAKVAYCDWPWNVDCKLSSFANVSNVQIQGNSAENKVGNRSENNITIGNVNQICPENNTDGEVVLFAHETNCSRYYECNWGEKVLMECPEDLHFNPQEDVCDWPENVKCKNNAAVDRQIRSVTEKKCPLENPPIDILLPHESDCTKFYKCDRGRKVVQNCPQGLQFHSKAGYCDWPWNVECTNSSATVNNSKRNDSEIAFEKTNNISISFTKNITYGNGKQLCPFEYNGTDVLLPHPNNCSKFLHCAHGQPVQKDCPSGLYFNTVTDRCDWPWNVQCKNSTFYEQTTMTPTVGYPIDYSTEVFPNGNTTEKIHNADCPLENAAKDILLPHESDYTKFYKCNWGKLELQSCPVGLHFNVTTNNCNWPRDSYCSYLISSMNIIPKCTPNYFFIPDELDCRNFYVCIGGLPQLITCDPDLYFNPESNSCEELEDISCRHWDPVTTYSLEN